MGQAQHLPPGRRAGRAGSATWRPADRAELEAIDGEPPFAIKPAIKENFFYETKAKAWRADTAAELATLFTRAAAIVGPGEVMVQELIPGEGRQQYSLLRPLQGRPPDRDDGRSPPAPASAGVRPRQHLRGDGRGAGRRGAVRAHARRIGYDGLVELEYKLDPRDGKFKLLDFNARTWGYHTLGPAAGVDFPYLLFRQQLGLPVEAQRARAGVRWVRLLTDVPMAAGEIAAGRLGLRAYLASLRSAEPRRCSAPAIPPRAWPSWP